MTPRDVAHRAAIDEARTILRDIARYARKYPTSLEPGHGCAAADVMDGNYRKGDLAPRLLCKLGYLEFIPLSKKEDYAGGSWWLTEKGRAAVLKLAGLAEAQTVPPPRRPPDPPPVFVQTCEVVDTSFGPMTYLKVGRHDDRPMAWTEVWQAFTVVYPDKWAVQFFPPADRVVDEANRYHLYMLDEPPSGVDINRRD